MGPSLDAAAVRALRDLYADLEIDGRVLDLCSSSREHFDFPPDELVAEPFAATLPFEDASFDHALCYAGAGAMDDPAAAFAEVARVLRPGGCFVCVFTGAPQAETESRAWRATDDAGRVRIVRRYFERTPGFGPAESDLRSSLTGTGDRLWAVWATRVAR